MTYAGRIEAFMTVPSGVTVSATNSGGGPTSVSLTAGSYTPTSFVAHLVARLNAVRTPANWTGSLSVGSSGTGLVTLNCTGTWALTFTTAEVGTVLGFSGNIGSRSSAAIGTLNARGLWLPDCPATVEGDPDSAPLMTDIRSVESPYGSVTTYKNAQSYVHEGLRYSHVQRARVHRTAEATTYASLQSWIDDTQLANGHSWFSTGSPFLIYWDSNGSDRALGYELNAGAGPANGWSFSPPIGKLQDHVKMVNKPWLGMWSVELPRIVSAG